MKILITGSNGLLGQKLVELIQDQEGYQLIATARGKNRLSNLKESVTYDEMDITDPEQVDQIIDRHQPDVVINTAAMTQVDDCENNKGLCKKLNVDAVGYLVSACERNSSFFIHLSTDFIFDGEDGPYDENAQANPLSYYGESKLDSEKIVTTSKIDWAIVRTVLVYGIAQDMSRSNIILWVKKSLEEKKDIQVVNDQWRTPTLAEDLAMGCFLIAKKKAKGIFNISGKDFLTPYEMAIKTANYFDLDMSTMKEADASTFSQPAKRPPRTGFIIDKAIKELGYQPRSFEEGIDIVAKQINPKINKIFRPKG